MRRARDLLKAGQSTYLREDALPTWEDIVNAHRQ